jgi:hypothetical protein
MDEQSLALTHDEAFELLAFLVTSAQDCLSESPNYGVYRLLSGAEHLARFWQPRMSGTLGELLNELITRTGPEGAKRDMEPESFKAFIAEMCCEVGHEVKRRGQAGGSSHDA